jgi:hypothetical protein
MKRSEIVKALEEYGYVTTDGDLWINKGVWFHFRQDELLMVKPHTILFNYLPATDTYDVRYTTFHNLLAGITVPDNG